MSHLEKLLVPQSNTLYDPNLAKFNLNLQLVDDDDNGNNMVKGYLSHCHLHAAGDKVELLLLFRLAI